MEEKKVIQISLSTVFLIIAIIVIVIMAYYIYIEKTNANKEISGLKANASNMQNTIDDLQGKIDSIFNTINKHDTNVISNNVTSNTNVSDLSESVVTEKQRLDGTGYTITLYSNNEVKITPIIKDLQTIFGNTGTVNGTEKNCNVTGFSGKIEKMYQGNNGTGVDPITFFIMEDGTVQYIQPFSQIFENNNTIPAEFKANEKINNLTNVIDLKLNPYGVIIAITKDGKEIKCWNEWMGNM